MNIAIATVAYLWAFWAVYVLVMGIYRAHLTRRLAGLNRVLALPVVLVAYLTDVLANLTVATVLFADWPAEWLVTKRLKRYKAAGTGWRARLASAICDGLLDPFDPTGDHC